jgi:predicted ATPase
MTATKTNALDGIAATMRSHILRAGALYSHRKLERGLEIVLQRHTEADGKMRWRLALGRTDVSPSEEEIAICRNAFGVPAATEHQALRSKSRPNPKTNRARSLFVVEMYWYENE